MQEQRKDKKIKAGEAFDLAVSSGRPLPGANASLKALSKQLVAKRTRSAFKDIGRDLSGPSRLREAMKSVQMPAVESAIEAINRDLSARTRINEAAKGLSAASAKWEPEVIEMDERLREAS